jgi:hypothetical protein
MPGTQPIFKQRPLLRRIATVAPDEHRSDRTREPADSRPSRHLGL